MAFVGDGDRGATAQVLAPPWVATGLAVAGAAFGYLLAVHADYYADDALISARFAVRFAGGAGLTWNDGDTVEGYTNLLWVIATAGLLALGLDVVAATRVLAAASLSAVVLSLLQVDRTVGRAVQPSGGLLAACLFVAVTPAFPVWTLGGMETLGVAAALATALAILLPTVGAAGPPGLAPAATAGAVLAAGTLLRADFPVLVALVVLAWAATSAAPPIRRLTFAAVVAGIPATAFLLQTTFRLLYHHDYVPNTFRAKVAFTGNRFSEGVAYVADGFGTATMPLAFASVAALAILAARRDRAAAAGTLRPAAMLAAVGLGSGAYTVVVGGDFFPAFRFLVPAYVAVALLLVVLWRPVSTARPALRALVGAMLAILVATHGVLAARQPLAVMARTETWVWTCRAFAEELKARFADRRPTMAVTAAGCLPFYTGFRSLDMFGLVDRELPRRRPANFGEGYLGHELLDVAYVMERRPDFIVMHIGEHPYLINAFTAPPAFFDDYAPMAVPVPALGRTFWVWAHREFRAAVATGATSP